MEDELKLKMILDEMTRLNAKTAVLCSEKPIELHIATGKKYSATKTSHEELTRMLLDAAPPASQSDVKMGIGLAPFQFRHKGAQYSVEAEAFRNLWTITVEFRSKEESDHNVVDVSELSLGKSAAKQAARSSTPSTEIEVPPWEYGISSEVAKTPEESDTKKGGLLAGLGIKLTSSSKLDGTTSKPQPKPRGAKSSYRPPQKHFRPPAPEPEKESDRHRSEKSAVEEPERGSAGGQRRGKFGLRKPFEGEGEFLGGSEGLDEGMMAPIGSAENGSLGPETVEAAHGPRDNTAWAEAELAKAAADVLGSRLASGPLHARGLHQDPESKADRKPSAQAQPPEAEWLQPPMEGFPGGGYFSPGPFSAREPTAIERNRLSYPPVEEDIPQLDPILLKLLEVDGSDVHLSVGKVPMFRIDGRIRPSEGFEPMTERALRGMLNRIMPPAVRAEVDSTSDGDFAYAIEGKSRFRVNIGVDRHGTFSVLRRIPYDIATPEALGLPKRVLDLCWLTKGLVLVTGPTGCGKSTTLATLIDVINSSRADHIITIEDPIEFIHPDNRKALIRQREVGAHTTSFKKALRAALREDPDIVLVGELRDLETTAIAIETAETGHLVFGTLHTSTAASTVDRLIDQFPAERQEQIRMMLSESLKGVISQTLCRKIEGGRVAAFELLLGSKAVSNLIREGKTFQIQSILQTSKKVGMMTMAESLMMLVRDKVVTPEEAYLRAVNKDELKTMFEKAGIRLNLKGFLEEV